MDGTDDNHRDRIDADLRHALNFERGLISHIGSDTDQAGNVLLQGWTAKHTPEGWVIDVFLRSPDHHHGLTVAVERRVPSRNSDLGMDLDTFAMIQASGTVEKYFTRVPSEEKTLRYRPLES